MLHTTHREIALGFGLFGLLLSALYVLTFGYDLEAIPVHVFILVYAAVLLLGLVQLLLAFRESRLARALSWALCFSFLFILASTYISNFLSSFFWSEPMYDSLLFNSYQLLFEYYSTYFSHAVPVFFMLLNTHFSILLYSLTLGLIGIVLTLVILVRLTRHIHARLDTHNLNRTEQLRLLGLWVLLVIVAGFAHRFITNTYASNNWRGEFLSDTFFSRSHLVFSGLHRDQIVAEDRAAFEHYEPGAGNGQNLVLIIVDAMRGNYVYDPKHAPPFISKMVAEKKFQQPHLAYSTCSYSTCGIMGIVSSKNVIDLHADNVKIQEVLRKAHYHTYSVLAGYPDWYGMKDIYQKTFDTYIDSDISGHPMMLDDIITDSVRQFDLHGNQPFYLYLRMMSVHEYGKLKPEYSNISRYEYANRMLQADDYLRQVFEMLEQKGVLHNTTVIITGDHGDSQGEKHEYGHNLSLYQNQVQIPIFIYDEQQHYPEVSVASSLDIIPTLVDRAALPVPAFWSGISLLKNTNADRFLFMSKAGAQYQTDRMRAVTWVHHDQRNGDKIYKYIYTGAKRFSISKKKEEIYELLGDPEENTNLYETINPAIRSTLLDAFHTHFRD